MRDVTTRVVGALVATIALGLQPATPAAAQEGAAEAIRIPGLGTVMVRTTGSPPAQSAFARGVLALHSFWYVEARRSFREARRIDPGFALAYWGEALTHDQPIWGGHDAEDARRVLHALDALPQTERARWSERERLYLQAVRELFGDGPLSQRRRQFERAMAALTKRFPGDDEALAFHALMVIANSSRRDESERILAAAAQLETLRDRNPDHPGALHYLIHAYDTPELAVRGLPMAEAYADVAPDAFHAVHMPAHIYRQLGDWQRVAAFSRRAYDVSVAWVERAGLSVMNRDFHSLSWLHTALLRLGRRADASAIHEHIDGLEANDAERRQLDRIKAALERELRRGNGGP
jgi:tetratricopeptide (TPR) repeat protein